MSEQLAVSIKTASRMLDLKERRIRDMCLQGKIKGKKVGRTWLIAIKELERLIK